MHHEVLWSNITKQSVVDEAQWLRLGISHVSENSESTLGKCEGKL